MKFSITPSFRDVTQSRVATYTHSMIDDESFFLTTLDKDAVDKFTTSNIYYNDLLFDDSNDESFISCGLPYTFEPMERPDLVNFPRVFTKEWHGLHLDGSDKFFIVSVNNNKIIIRKEFNFPGVDCELTEHKLKDFYPKFYAFLKDIKKLKVSCYFMLRANRLFLVSIIRHLDGQPQPQDLVDVWAKEHELARPIFIKDMQPNLLFKTCSDYRLSKLIFNNEQIFKISSPWYSFVALNKDSLDTIPTLIKAWGKFRSANLEDFAKKVNRVKKCDQGLAFIESAANVIRKLYRHLKVEINSINGNREKYKFSHCLPPYLQKLAFHIINVDNKDFAGFEELYEDVIRINLNLKPIDRKDRSCYC